MDPITQARPQRAEPALDYEPCSIEEGALIAAPSVSAATHFDRRTVIDGERSIDVVARYNDRHVITIHRHATHGDGAGHRHSCRRDNLAHWGNAPIIKGDFRPPVVSEFVQHSGSEN